eukprot:359153-Chlamydomonas_euryale.AAC.6
MSWLCVGAAWTAAVHCLLPVINRLPGVGGPVPGLSTSQASPAGAARLSHRHDHGPGEEEVVCGRVRDASCETDEVHDRQPNVEIRQRQLRRAIRDRQLTAPGEVALVHLLAKLLAVCAVIVT